MRNGAVMSTICPSAGSTSVLISKGSGVSQSTLGAVLASESVITSVVALPSLAVIVMVKLIDLPINKTRMFLFSFVTEKSSRL